MVEELGLARAGGCACELDHWWSGLGLWLWGNAIVVWIGRPCVWLLGDWASWF